MTEKQTVFLVDDDEAVRDSLVLLLQTAGIPVEAYESAEVFLKAYAPARPGCLILDMKMPGMTGADLQAELSRRDIQIPIIFLTAHGDIPMTVRAIKAGAVDFLTKPVEPASLLELIRAALRTGESRQRASAEHKEEPKGPSAVHFTPREREVLLGVVSGHSNKEIARHLGISHRTVEIHRARVMEKTGSSNVIDLARFCDSHQITNLSEQEAFRQSSTE